MPSAPDRSAVFEPGSPRTLAVAGQVMEAVAEAPRGCELLARFLADLPAAAAPATLRLRVVETPLDAFPSRDAHRDVALTVSRDGDARCAAHDDGGSARLDDHTVTVSLAGTPDDVWTTGRHLLAWALQLLFNRLTTPMVHGALIRRGGTAVVIVGPSGAGKSTLAVAALASGWTVHGDDMTVLRSRAGALEASTVPRRLMVDPELAAAVPDQAAVPVANDARQRLFLPDAVQATDFVPISAVVHVAHHDGSGVLEEHSTDVAALAPALGDEFDPGVMRRNLGVAAQFVALPTYRLRHAADPAVRVERAAALLAQVVS